MCSLSHRQPSTFWFSETFAPALIDFSLFLPIIFCSQVLSSNPLFLKFFFTLLKPTSLRLLSFYTTFAGKKNFLMASHSGRLVRPLNGLALPYLHHQTFRDTIPFNPQIASGLKSPPPLLDPLVGLMAEREIPCFEQDH